MLLLLKDKILVPAVNNFPFLFPASCGIPFQVLPDYQEGAEQVRCKTNY